MYGKFSELYRTHRKILVGEKLANFANCELFTRISSPIFTYINTEFKMAGLLKYFSHVNPLQNEDTDDKGKSICLPDPNGELSKVMPASSIEAINTVVHAEVLEEKHSLARGPYISLTPAQKYSIGKRAAENGTLLLW